MIDLLKNPWHWSVGGLLIGLLVPLLLIIGNKSFGISSSLRHICAAVLPAKIPYFDYDWKKESWNLFFVGGVILGSFLAISFMKSPEPIQLAESTKTYLQSLGIQDFNSMLPTDLFSFQNLFSFKGFVFMVLGGFLVGFGTRYAGGCTSGHSIMGLSNLQLPSLIATICFMAGGFFVTWLVIPYLF